MASGFSVFSCSPAGLFHSQCGLQADFSPAQGRHPEAEPLYQRSLAILEKALGPEHPDVATSLENYAALLRQTARADEAERMEARAKAIRAKSE